jgi:3-hydroxyisobutyrate dehydrogenase-like beta-hydroxyacid dehydrogenase
VNVLLLNPGQMGEQVGVAAQQSGAPVYWSGEGRGAATAERAARAGLTDAGKLADALAKAEMVLSVVPPHAAQATAEAVSAHGYSGIYVDVNAVSPATGKRVHDVVCGAGATYVDGGIIGPPPKARGQARLYLAGPDAKVVAGVFADSIMDARVLDEAAGSTAASALKMAYAGWTKGSSALLLAVRAMARVNGIEAALLDEWDISISGQSARSDNAARANAFKAWRFVGEMEEISSTMAEAGLPGGFHAGAAELYQALESYKDQMDLDPATVYKTLAGES